MTDLDTDLEYKNAGFNKLEQKRIWNWKQVNAPQPFVDQLKAEEKVAAALLAVIESPCCFTQGDDGAADREDNRHRLRP